MKKKGKQHTLFTFVVLISGMSILVENKIWLCEDKHDDCIAGLSGSL